MQRPLTMRFLPGYWAFPGGAAEASDDDAGVMARLLGTPPVRAAHDRLVPVVTAVRELFEETGVLLAQPLQGGGPAPDLGAWRRRVRAEPAAFGDLLATFDLYIVGEQLRYLHRWVTGTHHPIRFDARFFVALLPPGQTVDPFAGELAGISWLSPGAALQAWRTGRMPMADATRDSLAKLAGYPQMAALLAALPAAPELTAERLWHELPTVGRS